jgi:ankyrin repeat protein
MGCALSSEARLDTVLAAIDRGDAETLRAALTANKMLANGGPGSPGDRPNRRCPLFRALVVQQPYLAEMLLQCGADCNVKLDKYGSTLLHLAALWPLDDPVFIDLLVRYEARVDERDALGETPLHRAAGERGSLVTAQMLLAAHADVQAQNAFGHTPLVLAVQSGNQAVLALLLDSVRGALSTRIGEAGLTLLHEACRIGAPAPVAALLASGADANALATNGSTPLLVAVFGGNAAVASTLLNGGASPNLASATGVAPLHVACSGGHLSCVELLLNSGADLSQRARLGHSPLHYAAWAGAASVVELLLCRGADAQARTVAGYTPLHEACRKGRAEAAKLLVRAGSSLRAEARGGERPVDLLPAGDSETAYAVMNEPGPDGERGCQYLVDFSPKPGMGSNAVSPETVYF